MGSSLTIPLPNPTAVHPVRDLRFDVRSLGRVCSANQRRLVHLIARLDRSNEWILDGAATCSHWVAVALDVEVSTAREWLRVGNSLRHLHEIDAAFEAGRISYSKVRTLTRVATISNEAELCAIAERTLAGHLAHALAAHLGREEDPSETERRQQAARSLTWRVEPDGMVTGTFRLPPLPAAALTTMVDTWIMRADAATIRGRHASVEAHPPPTVATLVWPSIAQQRADALIAIATDGGGSIDTEIVVHLRSNGAMLDDGTPVAGSIVERLAPLSFIRVLIHDAESNPINASGRQRHPTTKQKRVVLERDGCCVDCGATAFVEYDHVPNFEESRHTIVDELQVRCRACHRSRHQRASSC